jgi:hypothetical protein
MLKSRPPAKLIWNEDHWLDRAEEARAKAAGIRNPECRRIMTELAATYEHLARLTADFKAAAGTTPSLKSDARVTDARPNNSS